MYRINETVRATYGKDGAVILDVQRGRMIRLNITGSFILQSLERNETESQIIEGLSLNFHVPPDIAETDVKEFLDSMEQEGLVRPYSTVVAQ